MDKLYQDILLHQFLKHLMGVAKMDLQRILTIKQKGNAHYNLLIQEEKVKETLEELGKIGNDHVFDMIGQIKDKFNVKLKSFEIPEKK